MTEENEREREEYLSHISTLISEEENSEIFKVISLEETNKATFQLAADSPGTIWFYCKVLLDFLDIIGGDLHKVVEESRRRMAMLGTFNPTFIVLFPKKEEVQTVVPTPIFF